MRSNYCLLWTIQGCLFFIIFFVSSNTWIAFDYIYIYIRLFIHLPSLVSNSWVSGFSCSLIVPSIEKCAQSLAISPSAGVIIGTDGHVSLMLSSLRCVEVVKAVFPQSQGRVAYWISLWGSPTNFTVPCPDYLWRNNSSLPFHCLYISS